MEKTEILFLIMLTCRDNGANVCFISCIPKHNILGVLTADCVVTSLEFVLVWESLHLQGNYILTLSNKQIFKNIPKHLRWGLEIMGKETVTLGLNYIHRNLSIEEGNSLLFLFKDQRSLQNRSQFSSPHNTTSTQQTSNRVRLAN